MSLLNKTKITHYTFKKLCINGHFIKVKKNKIKIKANTLEVKSNMRGILESSFFFLFWEKL